MPELTREAVYAIFGALHESRAVARQSGWQARQSGWQIFDEVAFEAFGSELTR
jgi:hypothetical protein